MERRVADSDKALVEMEGRWSYCAGADNVDTKNWTVFQNRVDDARAFRTELEAECAIKSKSLVEYQEEIMKQLTPMESNLAYLQAEKRNPMISLPGMRNDDDYYRTLRTAWEDAEKRASVAGMDRHTWPVHRPLNAAEYAKELMLHLSNITHQTGSGKRDLAKEIDKRDTRIREKDIMLAEKDAQIQEQDAQIREKDSRIRKKDAQIRERTPRSETKTPISQGFTLGSSRWRSATSCSSVSFARRRPNLARGSEATRHWRAWNVSHKLRDGHGGERSAEVWI